MDLLKLDFEQARTKHILFKSRLRAILYGVPVDEAPVLSQYECGVGKWIYNGALQKYGHITEMVKLEKVHTQIHEIARELIAMNKAGDVERSRKELKKVDVIAEELLGLLHTVEDKIRGE